MITASALKTACNQLLKSRYPDMDIYGAATAERLAKPCFYTEIVPYASKYESRNWVKASAGYKITFMQQVPDEKEQLEAAEEIRLLFGLKLAVEDRKLDVREYDVDYIGEYNDILQITVRFSWYENLYKPKTSYLMEHIEMRVDDEKKGEQRNGRT